MALALAAGLAIQAGFVAAEAGPGSEPPPGRLRALLVQADRRMPAGAPFAVTSGVRAVHARYVLYPRPWRAVSFAGGEQAVRTRLRRHGVRYVLAVGAGVPPALRAEHPWYRVVVTSPAGRLLEVRP